MKTLGAVIIGRNEGSRLEKCFKSTVNHIDNLVYVDSGSTDSSVTLAKKMGVHVVELDMSEPFSAARARNVGFAHLLEVAPQTDYVQFIDGDCEIIEGWFEQAQDFLFSNPEYALVCGRLHEKFPEASIYNLLCDIEWDGPVGDIQSCGGLFMIRKNAFQEIDGMRNYVVAGEEPEMCLRLRRRNWKLARLKASMAYHDSAMEHFSQWWKRLSRSGFAYALAFGLHGFSEERFRLKECLRIWSWGFILPLVTIVGSVWFTPWFLLLLSLYPLKIAKIYSYIKTKAPHKRAALAYAGFTTLDKWPQLFGQIHYLAKICFQRKQTPTHFTKEPSR